MEPSVPFLDSPKMGLRVQASGFRPKGSGFRVSAKGFRLQGFGLNLPNLKKRQIIVRTSFSVSPAGGLDFGLCT
jgi:hypothetical protein